MGCLDQEMSLVKRLFILATAVISVAWEEGKYMK